MTNSNIDSIKELREKARDISIVSVLQDLNIDVKTRGHRYVCSSPFSEDRNPSLVIYPENTFYDFSTGIGGDTIDLARSLFGLRYVEAIRHLTGTESDYKKHEIVKYSKIPKHHKKFDIQYYISRSLTYDSVITSYADKRGFDRTSYVTSFYRVVYEEIGGDKKYWERPCVGFPHKDEEGNICGIKFRHITNDGRRFSSRGRLAFYTIENIWMRSPTLFIVESETSASTLSKYLKDNGVSFVIISFGGVNNIMKRLPEKWNHISNRKIIIDYDGDEDLYLSRLEKFAHLKARPITMRLKKGDDLNTLILSGKIDEYKDSLIIQ